MRLAGDPVLVKAIKRVPGWFEHLHGSLYPQGIYGPRPPYLKVVEPSPPPELIMNMTHDEMMADMQRTFKVHIISWTPNWRAYPSGYKEITGVTLTASKEAMADLAKWAKVE